jgi:hypothetical protein
MLLMELPWRRGSSLSFTRQLQIAFKSAGFDAAVVHCSSHRASGFSAMATISEPTLRRPAALQVSIFA